MNIIFYIKHQIKIDKIIFFKNEILQLLYKGMCAHNKKLFGIRNKITIFKERKRDSNNYLFVVKGKFI